MTRPNEASHCPAARASGHLLGGRSAVGIVQASPFPLSILLARDSRRRTLASLAHKRSRTNRCRNHPSLSFHLLSFSSFHSQEPRFPHRQHRRRELAAASGSSAFVSASDCTSSSSVCPYFVCVCVWLPGAGMSCSTLNACVLFCFLLVCFCGCQESSRHLRPPRFSEIGSTAPRKSAAFGLCRFYFFFVLFRSFLSLKRMHASILFVQFPLSLRLPQLFDSDRPVSRALPPLHYLASAVVLFFFHSVCSY